MSTRIIKWGVIAILMACVGWLCFQWGYTSSQENAAEKRREAVESAVKEQNEQFQRELAIVQKEAKAYRERLNDAHQVLESKDKKINNMEGGEEQCFDQESLELYNQY